MHARKLRDRIFPVYVIHFTALLRYVTGNIVIRLPDRRRNILRHSDDARFAAGKKRRPLRCR